MDIKEHFSECLTLPEGTPDKESDTYVLTDEQMKVISYFSSYMGTVCGRTIERVRYITNGHMLIPAFAITMTDAWGVFREVFSAVGDNWYIDGWNKKALKSEAVSTDGTGQALAAIESWSEDSEALIPLLSYDGISLFKNSKGQIVSADSDSVRFAEWLDFSLDDCDSPASPIPMTHCSSGGFGGILMPVQSDYKHLPALLEEVMALLKLRAP